jgi:NAD(P)-dependent dehydrogenase (short-subunit alcohol dehydrogenase family)
MQLRKEGGPECHPIVADVSRSDAERQIAQVLERYTEALDVLINNAGNIKKHRGLHNTSVEDLEDLYRVHCVGAFRCTKGALPFLMRRERAIIVNISSRWGSIGRTVSGRGGGIYSYQIAKCAQNMLTACLDQELREFGVRVMAVHPGKLKTEVAAPDADTAPQEAARELADWINRVDQQTECGLYDLMGERYIEW